MKTTEELAEEFVKNHKDFKTEGLSEYFNGILNGYDAALKSTTSKKYFLQMFKPLFLDVLNIGMTIRQNQLSGHEDKSGNEIFENWFNAKLNDL